MTTTEVSVEVEKKRSSSKEAHLGRHNKWSMTNTVYFHNTIRDDVSTTTEDEETPHTSNRYTHHQQGSSSVNPNDDEGGILEYSNLKEFSFNELETAARNFHKNHVLGEKTFGSVYIGLGEFDRLDYARRYSNSDYIGILEYSNSRNFNEYPILREGTFGSVYKGWIDELEELEYTKRNSDNILGEGGSGTVFKGWIDENKLTATKPGKGIPVAIKRLEYYMGFHPHSEWQAEVNYFGRLYHPNLLRLLGHCAEPLLLVYEFMPEQSLADHLFEKVSTPLSWSVRMKIALGVAKGLAFLHSAPINVIHQHFKSSNIFLDTDYNAKLSCFNVAGDGPAGCLTAKSDVYTFGVVLLEMLSGRRVLDTNRPSGEYYLVDWAKPYLTHKRKVYRMADSRLEGQYSLKGFQKAANLALVCLSRNAYSRPNMDEVVNVLGEL